MKVVRMLGNCRLEVIEKERPALRPGWVVVKMRASAICGSDLHGLYEVADPTSYTPGHEFIGEVVEAGLESRVRPGERVAAYALIGCWNCKYCRQGLIHMCEKGSCLGFGWDGGDQEYVLVPQECCLPVPDDVTDEKAVLAGDVIGVSWCQMTRVHARAHEVAVVSGLGPMGLGAVIVAKYLGCKVAAVDINQYRVDLARRLGADLVLNAKSDNLNEAIKDFSAGQGIDVGLECAARAESLTFLLDNAAKQGRVCLIGENNSAAIRPSEHFIRRNLTMIGSTYLDLSEFYNVVQIVRSVSNVGDVITHRFPLTQAAQAFAAFKEGNTGKVVLLPE